MILRVVLGRLPSGTDAAGLVEARGRLARTARDVHGLDSLIVGARRGADSGDGAGGGRDRDRLAAMSRRWSGRPASMNRIASWPRG